MERLIIIIKEESHFLNKFVNLLMKPKLIKFQEVVYKINSIKTIVLSKT